MSRQFAPLQNDLILRAARGEPVERTPVWMMRQAGRYLPEYHTVRERANNEFFKMCQTPEYAAEVTIQPVDRFEIDAAIIFSDILVIPQAMGMTVEMKATVGPFFPEPLQSPSDLSKLQGFTHREIVDQDQLVEERLKYVFEAITLTRTKLNGRVPLIGFTGAPWTLMAYMIEGGGSKTFHKSKSWLFKHPNESQELLQSITNIIVSYLVGQVQAGAQLLQVFDSWAGELSKTVFEEFCLPYLSQIASRVRARLTSLSLDQVPLIVFAKGAYFSVEELASQTSYDVIGLDWQQEPNLVRSITSRHRPLCLQGNLDPCVLYAEPETIKTHVAAMLHKFAGGSHIANLGHGLHPDHNPEHVRVFVDAVHSISAEIKAQSAL